MEYLSTWEEQERTFPLVVGEKLEVGAVAGVWLAWWQMVPVGLAGVGVVIAAEWIRVLKPERDEEQINQSKEWGAQFKSFHRRNF